MKSCLFCHNRNLLAPVLLMRMIPMLPLSLFLMQFCSTWRPCDWTATSIRKCPSVTAGTGSVIDCRVKCKHILAVLGSGCQGWQSLPEFYRDIPQFNLDIVQPGEFSETTVSGNSRASVSSTTVFWWCASVSSTTVCWWRGQRYIWTRQRYECRVRNESWTASRWHDIHTTLQSKVRQTLAVISGLTYVVVDWEFLENQCRQLQDKVKEFRSKSSATAKHTVFRCSRRTVKSSIRGSALRRRLALIRARRRTRLRQRRLHKSQLSGSEFMFLFAVCVLLVTTRNAYSSRLDIYVWFCSLSQR